MSGNVRRRFWSAEEKTRIVGQARVPGASVSQVARRYDVNANLVFKWLRDPRFGGVSGGSRFLPVEVLPDLSSTDVSPSGPEPVYPEPSGRIGIILTNGHRLEITGSFDSVCVIRLVRGLMGDLAS